MLSEKGVHFLAIEGAIGVGKTSLAKIIAERWGAMFIEENFADNPFLEKFFQWTGTRKQGDDFHGKNPQE